MAGDRHDAAPNHDPRRRRSTPPGPAHYHRVHRANIAAGPAFLWQPLTSISALHGPISVTAGIISAELTQTKQRRRCIQSLARATGRASALGQWLMMLWL